MLTHDIKRAITRGLITGAAFGIVIAIPIAWFFGGVIKWTLIGTALGASVTVNACIVWAILTDKRAHTNRCANCAYDLSGLNTTICPECGLDQTKAPDPYQP